MTHADLPPELPRLTADGRSRIGLIRTTIVNLPLVAPYRWAPGQYGGMTKAIVEVETHDGIVGLGEAADWRHASVINDELAPGLIGSDVWDLETARRRVVPPLATIRNTAGVDAVRAFGAIEMALWDIRAKALSLPLYVLLGGSARTEIPFTEYFAARERRGDQGGEASPDAIGEFCARMVEEHASPCFEGKVGFVDFKTDVAIAQAVREAIGPERMLRLDANMGWSVDTARRALARLSEFDIANVEDPVSEIEDMVRLRQHSPIPFSSHTYDLRRAVALGVPDAFVMNLTALGGIRPTQRAIAACAAMGVGFWFYSGDTGVATAGYLHLAAAEPSLRQPSQSLLRWYTDDVIQGGPFVPEQGVVHVPDEPGLGVTLDGEAVRRLHRHFQKHGPIEQFGVDPVAGLYLELPRY